MRESFSERCKIMKKTVLKIIVSLFMLFTLLGFLALIYYLKPALVTMMYTCLGGVFLGHLFAKFSIWVCKKLGL